MLQPARMLTVRGTYREKIYLAIFEALPNANFTSVPDLGFGNFLLVVSVLVPFIFQNICIQEPFDC
jgi:hypothetical protein